MLNVTIINLKTAIKYLGIAVLLIICIAITRFFWTKNNKKAEENLENINLTNCIGDILPDIEGKKTVKISNRGSNLKRMLNTELSVMNTLIIDGEEDEQIIVENNKDENIEENSNEVELAKTGVETQKIENNNIPEKFNTEFSNVKIKNESDRQIANELLEQDLSLENKKDVIIFHTHTCESYTSSENYSYEMTGSYRTTDLNFTVSRVGDELEKQLQAYNYNVYHDKTYHDYPAYSGSYGRSLTTVQNILNNNMKADMIIDLHRDAVGSSPDYAPSVKIGEETAAQLMFVIGTDGGGLEHANWMENLKFAVKIQQKANELYPDLFRPIIVRNSRYNQNLGKAATIIEVGATGNTMEQCLTSMKYLAKVINEVIK